MALDSVFEFSPSAVSKWRRCQMDWGFTYIHGLRGPQGTGASRGKKIHSEMEAWLEDFEVPTDPAAKRLMPIAPHPMHPDKIVEGEFRILFPVGAGKGFADLRLPRPSLKHLPDLGFSLDIPIVYDWKSTSRLDMALTETELGLDPQGVMYGIALRLDVDRSIRNVPDVDLVWAYTGTKQAAAFPVKTRQTLTILEDGVASVLNSAAGMRLAKEAGNVADLEYDLRKCETGWKCPHRTYCPAYAGYHRLTPEPVPPPDEEEPMSEPSIFDKLKALSNAPMKPTPPPEPAPETISEAVTEAVDRVKPSPEPAIPHPDTSGTLVSPPEPIRVVPPDAPANLTPETAAGLGTEIVPKAPKEPKRRGRPPKTQDPARGLFQTPSERFGTAATRAGSRDRVAAFLKEALKIALDADLPCGLIASALDTIRNEEVNDVD